ncbi:hypothetical protein ACJDT4_22495 [Clostridium neuense]|uniref:YxlC family protein n=1 Tax=Clostridium neuense TaxID=1728934 RepID=A0ABW8TL01_9CLOT
MKKEERLCDDNLEKIGLIKEIDTLSLIEKVEKSNRKRELKIQNFIYAFAVVIVVMFQAIIAKKFGIGICILFNFFLVLPAPILILVKSTKMYRKGEDVK